MAFTIPPLVPTWVLIEAEWLTDLRNCGQPRRLPCPFHDPMTEAEPVIPRRKP